MWFPSKRSNILASSRHSSYEATLSRASLHRQIWNCGNSEPYLSVNIRAESVRDDREQGHSFAKQG